MRSMIEVLFGSKNAERVLIYIYSRQEGYAREIARFYNTDLKSIQNQLDKMESAGILVRREVGRTRPYTFNPRYSLLNELKGLLEKAFSFYPMKLQQEFVMNSPRLNAKDR
jgi:DNA-binding MarR family transcriptional regulator